jgi:predicted nucleic acid-binding protein
MNQIVIADASSLIVLQNIGQLSLLQNLFDEILITPEIKAEFGLDLPDWIKVAEVRDKTKQRLLNLNLDQGEASAIALCLENAERLLIIDERKGRRIAKELGLKFVGTLGVILKAKEKGLIDSTENILESLKNANFYISENLKAKILESE